MTPQNEPNRTKNFSFSSRIADAVWHPKQDSKSFQWWYFDALSDDGKEGLVIIFLDNFIFSPRYNKSETVSLSPEKISEIKAGRYPALVLIYYKDGKPLHRAINEYSSEDFQGDSENPSCKLGNSEFIFKAAPYGSGYLLNLDATLHKDFRIKANLEWLLVESDFLPDIKTEHFTNSHNWNLVAPRCDVTGKIEIFKPDATPEKTINFRGTGYHAQNTDSRWLAETISFWQWGRAHFTDCTAVFYRYKEIGEDSLTTKLFLVKNGELQIFDAECDEQDFSRNIFGLKYPKTLFLTTEAGHKLKFRQNCVIDSGFFYLRFLSEAEIESPENVKHKAFAVSEHLAPKTLKYRWLDWLTDMRIGRNGKGSFLP